VSSLIRQGGAGSESLPGRVRVNSPSPLKSCAGCLPAAAVVSPPTAALEGAAQLLLKESVGQWEVTNTTVQSRCGPLNRR
jgi:hypothetical protein